MTLEKKKEYEIDSQRLKDFMHQKGRGWSVYALWKKTDVKERQLRQNLADGKMRGSTLLMLSEALDVTPFYFIKVQQPDNKTRNVQENLIKQMEKKGFQHVPVTTVLDEVTGGDPLPFDHYRKQTLNLQDTLRDFLLIRGASSEEIALLGKYADNDTKNPHRDKLEKYIEALINDLRKETATQAAGQKKGR